MPQKILIVDDRPENALILEENLIAQRYTVVRVANGLEALKTVGAEKFDLLITDLLMPEMTGMDVYADFKSRDPDLAQRMVFLSGGAVTQKARDFYEQVPNTKIEKPFDAARLRAVVQGFVKGSGL